MRRRIKDAKIKFISLVPRGANRLPVLYKSAEQTAEFSTLTKFDDERGELLSVVYAPEIRDAHGDIASADCIRKMAHSYAQDGKGVDIRHDEQPVAKDRAFVAESFIVQKGDSRFGDMKDDSGKPVDVAGAWAVLIKVLDQDLRRLYREGKWQGVSMQGPATLELEKNDAEDLHREFLDGLAKRLKGEQPRENDMDPKLLSDTIQKAIDAAIPVIVAKVKETQAPALATLPNPRDAKAVRKHLESLEAKRLEAEIDWNDADAVRKHYESLSTQGETDEQKVERLEKEAVSLREKLAKVTKSSTVPVGNQAPAPGPTVSADISKDMQEGLSIGKRMASYANGSRK